MLNRTALHAAQALLAAAQAGERIAGTGVTSIGRGTLESAVKHARAQVRLAEIDLAKTRIVAPVAAAWARWALGGDGSVALGHYDQEAAPTYSAWNAAWASTCAKEWNWTRSGTALVRHGRA